MIFYRRRKSGAVSVLVRLGSRRARLAGTLTLEPSVRGVGCYGWFTPTAAAPRSVRCTGILGGDAAEVKNILAGELAAAFGGAA